MAMKQEEFEKYANALARYITEAENRGDIPNIQGFYRFTGLNELFFDDIDTDKNKNRLFLFITDTIGDALIQKIAKLPKGNAVGDIALRFLSRTKERYYGAQQKEESNVNIDFSNLLDEAIKNSEANDYGTSGNDRSTERLN